MSGLLSPAATIGRLCAAFRERLGVPHCFAVSSGRAGLTLVLEAMKSIRPDRDEVLLPAYTCLTVPAAVVRAGLRVALFDIRIDDLDVCIEDIRESITERTLCVVVSHLYGLPCSVDVVVDAAREKGALVVDDAAQAMGAVLRGRPVGTFGDAGIFSLGRGKNITAVDGGLVVVREDELAQAFRRLLSASRRGTSGADTLMRAILLWSFLRPRLYWAPRRLTFLRLGESSFDPSFRVGPMNGGQAAMALRMLGRLDVLNGDRVSKVRAMAPRLKALAPGLHVPDPIPQAQPVYPRLAVRLDAPHGEPDASLGIVRSYTRCIQDIEALRGHMRPGSRKPRNAAILAGTLYTVPTHRFVEDRDMDAIVGSLRVLIEEGRSRASAVGRGP